MFILVKHLIYILQITWKLLVSLWNRFYFLENLGSQEHWVGITVSAHWTPLLHTQGIPYYQHPILHQSSTFVITDRPIWTHHYHPTSIVYFRVHFHSHQQWMWVVVAPCSHQHLVLQMFHILSVLVGIISHCCLNLYFSDDMLWDICLYVYLPWIYMYIHNS
jgi:hypothetical protein